MTVPGSGAEWRARQTRSSSNRRAEKQALSSRCYRSCAVLFGCRHTQTKRSANEEAALQGDTEMQPNTYRITTSSLASSIFASML